MMEIMYAREFEINCINLSYLFCRLWIVVQNIHVISFSIDILSHKDDKVAKYTI